MAKRRQEKVAGHRRRLGRGKKPDKLIKISSFKRKAKPKARTGIHALKPVRFEVIQYIDDQGRIVSKRKYRRIK